MTDVTETRAPIAPPGTPQLTGRAIVTGMLLGGVLSLSNLYVALRIGWSFGVTITAGVLAFAIFDVLRRSGVVTRAFGTLENNAMQSVASAAGYMTGGGTVAAIPALLLVGAAPLPWWQMLPWVATIAALGVVVAIPMKRQMIDVEKLRFPSGIAAAETLRNLHASGEEGASRARALGIGALIGAVTRLVRPPTFHFLPRLLPESIGLPFTIAGRAASDFTFLFEPGVLMIGAGAITGLRVAGSQMLGAVLCHAVLVPWALSEGIIPDLKWKNVVGFTVWGGSSLLLTSGLLAFAFQWRTVLRAFSSLTGAFGGAPLSEDEAREVPMRWFAYGIVGLGALVIALQWAFFGIAPWLGLVAVMLSFLIAIVASRATGETDTTPTGALGKLTQLCFGALDRGNVVTNLMTANATAGVALHSADLLTDLKSGWLLGADPRQQFKAQFYGVIAGSLFVVPAYAILVPDVTALDEGGFPAPAARTWAAVAQMLAQGIETLHPAARWSIVIGGTVGVVLVLIEKFIPRIKPYLPSAMGFGLAFTMQADASIGMFTGALLAWILGKIRADLADRHVVTVSSGLIAGESIVGIALAVATVMGLAGD